MFAVMREIPDELLSCHPSDLHSILSGPTLLILEGVKQEALMVSTLLHGNETSGFYALQQLLVDYQSRPLPRRLMLFFGNIAAARQGVRVLSGQPDYNRIWPGSALFACREVQMAQQLYDLLAAESLFAAVDVHNTTGINPPHACVNTLDTSTLQLATLFNRTVVYFTEPKGIMSMAMANLCPALTLECGRNSLFAQQQAYDFLNACLHLDHIPQKAPAEHDLQLYQTVAVVKVPEQVSFGFEQQESDICFRNDLDCLNFQLLAQGTVIATLYNPLVKNLQVYDLNGVDVADQFFKMEQQRLVTTTPVMPSLLSKDERVIRQDCLGYLMQPYPRAL